MDDASAAALGQRLRRAVHALPDAPPALVHAAIGLWPDNAPTTMGTLLRRLAAVLSFDSWAVAPTAAGLRSLRSPTRQLLYSAEGRDVDLRIAPAAQVWALTGQVLGPDETGSVELLRLDQEGDAPRQATLDTLGEFRIDGLLRGVYALSLRLGPDEVLLPPFEVGDVAR